MCGGLYTGPTESYFSFSVRSTYNSCVCAMRVCDYVWGESAWHAEEQNGQRKNRQNIILVNEKALRAHRTCVSAVHRFNTTKPSLGWMVIMVALHLFGHANRQTEKQIIVSVPQHISSTRCRDASVFHALRPIPFYLHFAAFCNLTEQTGRLAFLGYSRQHT